MSSNFILNKKYFAASFFLILILGYTTFLSLNLSHEIENENTAKLKYYKRYLASVPPVSKIGAEQIAWSYIKLNIQPKSLALSNSENSIVEVTVEALKDIPQTLNFKWILAQQVFSQDSLEGTIQPMLAGESQVFELIVQNFSKASQSVVSFKIDGNIGPHSLRKQVTLSSLPEESFEYLVQKKETEIYQQAVNDSTSGKVTSQALKKRANKFRVENVVK